MLLCVPFPLLHHQGLNMQTKESMTAYMNMVIRPRGEVPSIL